MLRYILASLTLLGALPAAGRTYTLDARRSVLAAVTHRAGIAGWLLHEHLVVARDAKVELEFEKKSLGSIRFRLQASVESLSIDDAGEQKEWYPRLESLHVVDGPFKAPSADDRARIRQTMLGASQLDAARFPEIRVELRSIDKGRDRFEDMLVTHVANVAVTIRGHTVERAVGVKLATLADERLEIEAIGRFRLSEFGITPYRAAFGAMRVDDDFHLVVVASALPAPAAP